MLGIAFDRVTILLLRLNEVVLLVLQEAPQVVVGIGGTPVEADGLAVVLLGSLKILHKNKARGADGEGPEIRSVTEDCERAGLAVNK